MYLKKLNKNKQPYGFTIIETMIFLVISSVIYVSVALLISGQLARYQAKDSVNNIESVVRGVLNDVSNGYYPQVGSRYSCTRVDNDKPTITPLGAGENRGENTDCVILGKSITFDTDKLTIDTWVANSDINALDLTKITSVPGLQETKEYKWGLKPKNPPVTYFILSTVLNVTGVSSFVSGAQEVKLFGQDLADITSSNSKVCFNDGNSLEFLLKGSLGLKSNFQDAGC